MTQAWPGQEVTTGNGGPQPILELPDTRREKNDTTDAAGKTWRTMSPAEVAQTNLPEGGVYQVNGLGQIREVSKPEESKTPELAQLRERRARIQTALQNLSNLREMVEASGMGVGSIVGQESFRSGQDFFGTSSLMNQQANDVAGAIEMVQGDLINQVRAEMQESGAPIGVKGADTEKEASRLAASIANLAQTQNEEQFLIGVRRAEDYYNRRLASINERVGASSPSEQSFVSGADQNAEITDEDRELAARIQNAWDNGAGLDELDRIAQEGGRDPVSGTPGIEDYLERRNNGVPVQWQPSPGGKRSEAEKLLSSVADSPLGAYAAGAANALTAGTLDEIAGAIEGGNAAERVQFSKDKLRKDNPVSSFAGEVTGATLAMIPVAKGTQALGRGALAGEAAYGAAYGAGENNENRLLGAGAGMGGAIVGDRIGREITKRFGRGGSSGSAEIVEELTPAQKLERAKKYGVDLSIGDVRGRNSKIIERTLDNMPGGGSVTGAARDRTRAQVDEAVTDVSATFGNAGSDEAVGDALQRGARNWIERMKGDGGKIAEAYDAIPLSPRRKVEMPNTVAALEEVNSQFASNPRLAELMKDSRSAAMLDALGDVERPLTWGDLKALRSAIGEDLGPLRIGSQTSRESTLRKLYGALSDDMRAAAEARGPKALAAFERANNLNRQVEQRIDEALSKVLGKDGMLAPEKAAQKLRGMIVSGRSTSDINTLVELRKSIGPREWKEVASGLIRLAGQPAKSEGREFQPEVFVRTFQDMTPKAKNLLFGGSGELRRNLDEFASVMEDMAASSATRNTSNTGMVVTGALGLSGGFQTLLTQTVSSYALARLWTHPPFVKWATGYAKMQRGAARNGTQPTVDNISKQIGLLDRLAKGQGPISADVIVFRDYLRNATSQAPERLAAEPTADSRPSEDTRQSADTTTARVPGRSERR